MFKSTYISMLFFASLVYAQNSHSLPTNKSNLLVTKLSEEERNSKQSFQQYVESLYINSVAVFEDGKLTYKEGEYPVTLNYLKSNKHSNVKSKDLNNIELDKIVNFKYQKGKIESALYGTNGAKTGRVYIDIND